MRLRRIAEMGHGVLGLLIFTAACAEVTPGRGQIDARIRQVNYASEQVYRLRGFVGYEIDLQFEAGESFVGLGAGDMEGLAYFAQDNHLFLKPKAASVGTNLTILTNRRQYQFDYTASARRPGPDDVDVMYAVRFVYPRVPDAIPATAQASRVEAALNASSARRVRNDDYWYCGHPQLRPVAAFDDGVHTRLTFGPRAEMPAIFVRNDDGSESLLNFSIDEGDVLVHRIAPRFILRRGKLTGCIVNKGYDGTGERLPSGTVAPAVKRVVQGDAP